MRDVNLIDEIKYCKVRPCQFRPFLIIQEHRMEHSLTIKGTNDDRMKSP